MSATDVVKGADGVRRCNWGDSTAELRGYHDLEWGRPVGDDARVYEKLCLEGFQAGLSWLTILRKREGFRDAFGMFDPTVVARFDEADIERLLADARIVRNRAKIIAAITNARATVRLYAEGTSLATVLWSHEPAPSRPSPRLADLPATTSESKALSKELKRRGFSFVGPTTVYSTMQSLGVVNDHLRGCQFHAVVEAERAKFARPS
jgi:DNA-3-methyladenine glycosylase I